MQLEISTLEELLVLLVRDVIGSAGVGSLEGDSVGLASIKGEAAECEESLLVVGETVENGPVGGGVLEREQSSLVSNSSKHSHFGRTMLFSSTLVKLHVPLSVQLEGQNNKSGHAVLRLGHWMVDVKAPLAIGYRIQKSRIHM